MDLILVVLCIQPFPYNMLRIRIFHIVDPFKIWNDQLAHPKGMREKLLVILLVLISPKCGYCKYHRDMDYRILLS